MIPERIGHYRIERFIAEGGMSLVYEALQENPRRTVALKVLRPGDPTPELTYRLEHEAQILGRLQHPNIAQVFEAGSFDRGKGPQPFIAMEFVRGRPLTRYAEDEGLGVRERLELLAEVCDGVNYAHQQGIIHRDLKPDNILIDERGTPKILDFGLARMENEELRQQTLESEVGDVFGTLAYMSPEHLRGDPAAMTICSDVYALGVLGYELLSGRLPHEIEGESIREVVQMIRHRPAVKLGMLGSQWKGDVEAIVAKAMEKRPASRYQSVSGLAADIRRHLSHKPIMARPPGTIYQLVRFGRRHKALAAGAALALFALLVGFVVSTAFLVKARQANQLALEARLAAEEEVLEVEAINRYVLTEMLEAANPWKLGREVKVVDVLERSTPKIDEVFAGQPKIAAAVRHRLGSCYGSLGLWPEATALLEESLAARLRLLGPADPETLETRLALSRALLEQGELEEAEQHLLAAHRGMRAAGKGEGLVESGLLVELYETTDRELQAALYRRELETAPIPATFDPRDG